jgi:hypothetical protein
VSGAAAAGSAPFLRVVKGDPSAEEIAALVVVLQAAAAQAARTPDRPRSEWSAHHRKVAGSLSAGPGGWRSSALPR